MGEEPTPMRVIESSPYSIYRVVKLKPLWSFSFSPGQNAELELSQRICSDCGTKTFSIASSPTEDYIMFATIERDSQFKKALGMLRPGDEVNVWGPYGHFTLDENAEEIVMIFHSIGVTPIRSMIIYSADKKTRSKILAIHIDEREDYLFKEDLARASRINNNIKVIWRKSLPSTDELRSFISSMKNPIFYASGPPDRVREITILLRGLGIRMHRETLKIESFSGY
ncbi:MAG TPA: FAD-dependent oxidoreductase [Sulfolobales archaeon]|nr:FAD-dependent oxidoreductase [Sulfolobales archaeon]